MTDAFRQPLIDLLRKFAGDVPIRDDTRLYHDLHIDGDDAHDMLVLIQKSFGTRFDGFDFAAHFPDETEALSERAARLFGWDAPRRQLTVGHLIAVITRGQWYDAEGAGLRERIGTAPIVKWVSRAVLVALILFWLVAALGWYAAGV